MIAHWLITVACAALAAWFLVCCWRMIRSEHRYIERLHDRAARHTEDMAWAMWRIEHPAEEPAYPSAHRVTGKLRLLDRDEVA